MADALTPCDHPWDAVHYASEGCIICQRCKEVLRAEDLRPATQLLND